MPSKEVNTGKGIVEKVNGIGGKAKEYISRVGKEIVIVKSETESFEDFSDFINQKGQLIEEVTFWHPEGNYEYSLRSKLSSTKNCKELSFTINHVTIDATPGKLTNDTRFNLVKRALVGVHEGLKDNFPNAVIQMGKPWEGWPESKIEEEVSYLKGRLERMHMEPFPFPSKKVEGNCE